MLFGKRFRQNKDQSKFQAKPIERSQPDHENGAQPDAALRSPWEAQNQETLDQIARFVDFAEGFTIGFVEISFANDVEAVVQALRRHPDCQGVQFHVLDASDPNLRHLKDFVVNAVWQLKPLIALRPSQKPVLVIRGLENSIGMLEDYPPVLKDLNFVRDAFIEAVPHPVLFCLPSYAINRIIRFAPDFWSWKSGTFRVLSSSNSQDQASIRALYAEKKLGNLNQLERQERIQLLERLAQEFSSLEGTRPKEDLRIEAKALLELGILYGIVDEFPKAHEAFKRVAQVLTKTAWQPETDKDVSLRINYLNWRGHVELQIGHPEQAESVLQVALFLSQASLSTEASLWHKCTTYRLVGNLRWHKGKVEEALNFYRQSLDICERIGNFQGKAATLLAIGKIKVDQGKVEEVLALYQQSLDIYDQIGAFQGKASTLLAIGRIKADRGEAEEALALYQQSLDIYGQIGVLQGKASTLLAIGRIKVDRDEIEEAIAFYQQSLEIYGQIGDLKGKAVALYELGGIRSVQGKLEEAFDLYQQTLALYNQTDDLKGKAITLHDIGRIKAQQGQSGEALALYQQSLNIKEQIGYLQGKAVTLHNIGLLKSEQGQAEEALAFYQQSLNIKDQIGDLKGKAITLCDIGRIKASQGLEEEALAFYQESLNIHEKIGYHHGRLVLLEAIERLKS